MAQAKTSNKARRIEGGRNTDIRARTIEDFKSQFEQSGEIPLGGWRAETTYELKTAPLLITALTIFAAIVVALLFTYLRAPTIESSSLVVALQENIEDLNADNTTLRSQLDSSCAALAEIVQWREDIQAFCDESPASSAKICNKIRSNRTGLSDNCKKLK